MFQIYYLKSALFSILIENPEKFRDLKISKNSIPSHLVLIKLFYYSQTNNFGTKFLICLMFVYVDANIKFFQKNVRFGLILRRENHCN
jgi:hypothetical protein